MASEDSAEYLIHRPLALLAVHVHRICDFHYGSQPSGAAMRTELIQTHGVFKELDSPPSGMKSPYTAAGTAARALKATVAT